MITANSAQSNNRITPAISRAEYLTEESFANSAVIYDNADKTLFDNNDENTDTEISKLSTEKLDNIIRLSELPDCDVDDDFLDAVVLELLCRRSGF